MAGSRERLVSAGAAKKEEQLTPEQQQAEEALIRSLRPNRLDDFVGQRPVVESLDIAIRAALQREEPLDHTLLHGPPGLGKTTIAHCIATEMGANIVLASGPALERPRDLLAILTNLEQRTVLFIDEIHRLPKVVEEYLYPAMEDFYVDFRMERGQYAQTMKLTLKPFTLVGATTRAGMLSSPLRNRFGLTYHLEFYTPEELATIVRRSAHILGVPMDDAGAIEIARRSRGTARIANRLLRRVRDYAQVCGDGKITCEIADAALTREGIDDRGLDALDRRYLEAVQRVYKGGPVGIEALAATLNEEPGTLIDMVEPFLLKEGLIARTPAGRKTTDGIVGPSAEQKALF